MSRFSSYIIVAAAVAGFLALKLFLVTPHFGDGNVYFYMARALLNGELPYRDFFLADGPILIFILAAVSFIFNGSVLVLQFVPAVFAGLSAVVMFALVRQWKLPLPFLAPIAYLFSFSILATSDYVTGVQAVIFFSLLGLLFWEKDKPALSGIFWALAILTKGYAVPAFLALIIYGISRRDWKKIIMFLMGAAIAGIVIMGPFLILNAENVARDTLWHHFNRPAGIPKARIFSFFLSREWLFILLALPGFWVLRKTSIIWPALATIAFLILFADIYYLYLISFFVYFVIAATTAAGYLWEESRSLFYVLAAVYAVFLFLSLSAYKVEYPKGVFLNAKDIGRYASRLPKDYSLYGSHEIAPLISIFSGQPLFGNFIDTNVQTFASGAHNLEAISLKAAENGIYLIAKVSDFPQDNIFNFGFDGFFSRKIFDDYCDSMGRFAVPGDSQIKESIAVYECKK